MTKEINSASRDSLQLYSQPSYEGVEKFWSYAKNALLFTRHVFNALSRSCPRAIIKLGCPCKLKVVVTHLKLFAVFSVPFDFFDLTKMLTVTSQSLKKREWKNVGWGVWMGSMLSANMFDNITTFVNAVLTVTTRTQTDHLGWTSRPVAFFLVGSGTVNRSIKIVKAYQQNEMQAVRADAIGIISNGLILGTLIFNKTAMASVWPPTLMATSIFLRVLSLTLQPSKPKQH